MTDTLMMPRNYAIIENDEMEYLEGGSWLTYKNAAALSQLSVIAGHVFKHAVATTALSAAAAVGAAAGATGVGLVVAVASALGTAFALSLTAVQTIFFGMAIGFYNSDRAFDHWGTSVWTWSATVGVRKASG